MISRADWDAAYQRLLAEGQKRLGPPPTFEEVDALSRGELPESEAERVRTSLAHYPELLRVLTEPFPANAEGVLTDQQLAADLARIREGVSRKTAPIASREAAPPVAPRKERFSSRTLAMAAGIAIAIAIGSVAVRQMTREPRAVVTLMLDSDGIRGGGRRGVPAQPPIQLSTSTDYTLQPIFTSPRHYREFRLELLDLSDGDTPPRRVWLREHVPQQPDGTLAVDLSTEDLDPGLYRLVLHGVNQTPEPVAEYTLRLSGP